MRAKQAGESINRNTENGLWKTVWGLCIPPRVRNFIWCGLHNSLPTRNRLASKGILKQGCVELLGEIACVLWHLWKHQNGLVFEGVRGDFKQIWADGIQMAVDYSQLCSYSLDTTAVEQNKSRFGGAFKGAHFQQINHVESALVAEALTLREALHFAIRQRQFRLEVESDSLQLIRSINRQQKTPMEIDIIVEDTHHLARYLEVKFQYTSRESNNAVHCVD
ncbi:hypothetical protein LIER_07468 [Lithospermum erythrorhizon]|uniref:RNase H type-1 domain-containing protein n=1 Tax=Lithospermum erythrorhizon TaxID=34254 RepID=A0AAV3PA07_LITER